MSDGLIILLGGLLGIVPGLWAIFSTRHKTRAEAASIISAAATSLIEPLQERVGDLEERVGVLEAQNEELSRQVMEFRALIRQLWEGVGILSRQLEQHCIPLGWNLKNYRDTVEKALEDNGE
jgi:hypothetical protein